MEGDQEKETTTAAKEISVYTAVAVAIADVKEKHKKGTEGFSHIVLSLYVILADSS